MSDNQNTSRRRVKLYMLNEDRQWDDKGTGFVSSLFVESLGGIALLVMSESDGLPLLESRIQPDTAYQKQQETLIVWSEQESLDLALSFQEKEGCDEVWSKICSVQGKHPSVDITQEVVEDADECEDSESEVGYAGNSSWDTIELPQCELSRLEEVTEIISHHNVAKQPLVTALLHDNYLLKLCTDLFHEAEHLNDHVNLQFLNEIVRAAFSLNDKQLLDVMLDPKVIDNIIGVLEYDPSKVRKANHREFLQSQTKFREPLEFENAEIRDKIQQTFRMQYIQECILPTPSLFDENQFHELSSYIVVNKMTVLNAITNDEKLMYILFSALRDQQSSNEKRLELTLFLKELCSIASSLESSFMKSSLIEDQALSIIPSLYLSGYLPIQTAATDILFAFVDNSPAIVRDFMLKEKDRKQKHLLINIMINVMCNDADPEMGEALRIAGMLRVLIDPESMASLPTTSVIACSHGSAEKSGFLRFFYQEAMPNLLDPLINSVNADCISRDCYRNAQLLYYIIDLLTFCIEQHAYHVKNLVLAKDLIRKILIFVQSRHSFLVLAAVRLFRHVIGLKDEFYNRYLTKNLLFRPIVKVLLQNGSRYNLINSAIIELFEFIYCEGIRSLIFHVIEQHWESLKNINYVPTFRSLHIRYEQFKDRARDAKRSADSPLVSSYSYDQPNVNQQDSMQQTTSTQSHDLRRICDNTANSSVTAHHSTTSSLGSLVDYPDEEDEEDEEEDDEANSSGPNPAKRARTNNSGNDDVQTLPFECYGSKQAELTE